MAEEGVEFIPKAHVGVNVDAAEIRKNSDAVIMATGATWPRDLKIPNRNLDGIHFGELRLGRPELWQRPTADLIT